MTTVALRGERLEFLTNSQGLDNFDNFGATEVKFFEEFCFDIAQKYFLKSG